MTRDVAYKQQTVSASAILGHLQACDGSFVPPLSERVDLALYAEKVANNAITFEAWAAETLVGLIGAYNNSKQSEYFITTVSVLPSYGSRGIAGHLLRQCVDCALHQRIRRIKLNVNKNSPAALRLYKSHGFSVTDEDAEVLTMELNLATEKSTEQDVNKHTT